MKTNLTSIYYDFNQLLKEEKKELSVLQLTGKIENFITMKFVKTVHESSKGKRFAITNAGCKGEKRIDLLFLSGPLTTPEIKGMVEFKYFRNIHRFWVSDAKDEIKTSMKELVKQVGVFKKSSHYGLTVKLDSKNKEIYAIPIASFVSQKKDSKKEKAEFFKKTMEGNDFAYHDLKHLKSAKLDTLYEDVPVIIFDDKFYVTLKVGLWIKTKK